MKSTLLLIAAAAALVAAGGCYQEIHRSRKSFADVAPAWRSSKPLDVNSGRGPGNVAATPEEKPEPKAVKMQVDEKIVNPILEARGNWTIRVAWTYCDLKKRKSALSYANDLAESLKKKGYHPYVTDLLTRSIVSVGAWDDPRDPELKRVWKEIYDGWLQVRGGRESEFRKAMESFYGKNTPFGDQPMPVSIIDLQMKMKGAYGIDVTEDEKRRYKEYLDGRKRN